MEEFKWGDEQVPTKLNKRKFSFRSYYICSLPSLYHPVSLNKFVILFRSWCCIHPSGISGLVVLGSRAKMVIVYCFFEIIYLHESGSWMASSPSWLFVKVPFHFWMCVCEIFCLKSSSPELLVRCHSPPVYCVGTDLLVTVWLRSFWLCRFRKSQILESNPEAMFSFYDSN